MSWKNKKKWQGLVIELLIESQHQTTKAKIGLFLRMESFS